MDITVELMEQIIILFDTNSDIQHTRDSILQILSGYSILRKEETKRANLDKKIEHFLAVKRIDGLAQRTLENYRLMLKAFASKINKNITQISTGDIREYMVYLTTQRSIKDSSLTTHINTLRSFFSWLLMEGLIRKNPMLKIKTKKLDKRGIRHPLTEEEMERLRDACKNYREKALVELYYSTGCRLSEVTNASINNLNMQERSLYVVGKGGKGRTVYFSHRAKFMLAEYFKRAHNESSLFCSTRKPYVPL